MTPSSPGTTRPDSDPLWYRDAIIYELHVRSFFDSTGNGIGDFPGLTSRLDYLQDLGITAIWLLPFYPSPLRDDGYDIADYREVNPAYGTLDDFRTFLGEAHRRGIRVITELVVNHTSDQHPWFQRARRAPADHPHRDYYVWSQDPELYSEARIIFKDFEASNWQWDPVAEAYYWHRFYHHQPDLNFENPEVQEELFSVLDYWFDMGVDGLRLDAVPYLYEREGTNCENLPETHAFLKKLRAHVDERYGDRMLLAEANQWPEDAAAYFGDGDECHMNFHFPIMPRLFMSVRMEDRFPLVDILEQTPEIPPTCQWAIFLRNHDELTLEMVTDEERDYMYRAYARDAGARINLGIRRRLAPLLENNRRKIELLNCLLMSLPGTPVIYYGDEIGMGDNFYLGDRNGVRTPFQWSSDRNAGFSRANPQQLYLPVIIDPEYRFESVNVEAQHDNTTSLLWWMRRLIALRRQSQAFGRGSFEWVHPDNRKVVAFTRRHEDEVILVVANLSRYAQSAEIELPEFRDRVPVELFGRTPFPRIGDDIYRITLGPHAFFWFSLDREREEDGQRVAGEAGPPEDWSAVTAELPSLQTRDGAWWEVAGRPPRPEFIAALATFMRRQRWFAGKGRELQGIRIEGISPLAMASGQARILRMGVDYLDHESESYLLPLAWTPHERGEALPETHRHAVVARLEVGGIPGILHDAVVSPAFGKALLELMAAGETVSETPGRGVLRGQANAEGGEIRPDDLRAPLVGKAEQSNTSLIFGDQWILKLFRKIEVGTHLDLEVGRALTATGFAGSPALGGWIDHRTVDGAVSTLGVLHCYVANEGDAWDYTLDVLDRFIEEVAPLGAPEVDLEPHLDEEAVAASPGLLDHLDPAFPDLIRLLGGRTGDLHRTLAGVDDGGAFSPEPFNQLYRRSLYQSLRNQLGRSLRELRHAWGQLPAEEAEMASVIIDRREEFLDRFAVVLDRQLDGQRIRTHGDFHLGQVLFLGNDFSIIDFEGEPARPLSERRLKRSPLRDVAGMIRSLDYAAHAALRRRERSGLSEERATGSMQRWVRNWYAWASAQYLEGYAEATAGAAFLPGSHEDRALLLELFLLEKSLYELVYELNNRPDWVGIPLAGVLDVLGSR